MVFIIDLPRFSTDSKPLEDASLTFFARELLYFCKAKGYSEDILEAMRKVDYTKTRDMAFIHSIGGPHWGEAIKRTGYPGLGTAVKTLGLQSGKGLEVDFVVRLVSMYLRFLCYGF